MGEARRKRIRRIQSQAGTARHADRSDSRQSQPDGAGGAIAAGTKKQHYSPRLHLKRFTSDSGKLFVYDKFTDKIFPASVDDVGHENHFLSVPELDGHAGPGSFFEEFFQPAESTAAPVIEDVLTELAAGRMKRVITLERKTGLARFLALQQLRTKMGRAQAVDMQEAMARVLTELRNEGYRGEIPPLEDWSDPAVARRTHAETLLNPALVDSMTKTFLDHVWFIFANESSTPLYTSDHPLCFNCHEPSEVRGSGPASYGAELGFPLSPEYQLTLVERRWSEQYLGPKVNDEGSVLGLFVPESIEYQRSLQVSGSFRFVYASKSDFALAREMCEKDPGLRRPPSSRIVINYGGRKL